MLTGIVAIGLYSLAGGQSDEAHRDAAARHALAVAVGAVAGVAAAPAARAPARAVGGQRPRRLAPVLQRLLDIGGDRLRDEAARRVSARPAREVVRLEIR